MLNTIKMTNDLLLIRRIMNEEPKTASGILLPHVEESSDTPWRGVVVAAGPGKPAKLSPAGQEIVDSLENLLHAFHLMPNSDNGVRGINLMHWQRAATAMSNHATMTARIPMSVKVGDTVIFSKNLFQEFKIGNEVFIAMGEASILGVLDSPTNP